MKKPLSYYFNSTNIYFGFIILFFVSSAVYSYATYFTKTITIKEKDSLRGGKYGQNVISDADGNIYTITNSMFYGFFTSTELYTKLAENKKYQIGGYGYRIPFLGLFPSIISAKVNL